MPTLSPTGIVRPYWLILFVFSLLRVQAQSPSPRTPEKYPIANQFEHLSVEDGLSNDYITAILQDRDGFMWFGTGEGLNKYDGSTFTVYKPNPSQPSRSFQNGYIMGLCEGDSTRLWAITRGGGLHEINRKTGVVTPHPIRADQANRWNNQHSVFVDHQHIVWVSAYAGLARYDPARHHFTLYPPPVADVPVITAFEDRQHRFWVATHRGLYLFDRSSGRFTPVAVEGLKGPQPSFQSFYLDKNDVLWLGTALAGYSLFRLDLRSQPWKLIPYNPRGELHSFVWRNTIHRDSTGVVWLGTTNGLQGINPTNDQVFTYQSDPNRYKGLSSNSIQVVYHDRSGMIWVGTDNGIDRQAVNSTPFSIYQIKSNERRASVPENRAEAVFKDSRGQLWFNNTPRLCRLSADQKRLDLIPPASLGALGDHYNEVRSFLPDGKGGVWMGSYDGLYHFDQASGKFTGYPSEMPAQFTAVQQKAGKLQGDIWVGGDGGFASFNVRTHRYTYYRYQPGKPGGIPDRFVYGLLVSQAGEVWIIIHRLGLCRLNPETGQITRYSAGPKGHLSSNDVRTLYEDQDGIIWVGTHQGGLNRFDPRTGRFTTISHQDGIPGNTIVGITGDASGHLWLSTNDGLCRVDPRTKAIQSYQVSDGLPSNNFKQNAVFRHGNQLIFGSENGIVQFEPDQIRDDKRPFPVYITGLTVLDRPRKITGNVIRLPHNENFLSFAFAALAYDQPRKNQYAYQLVGINRDWVQNGNRTVANFTSLPPGHYTFRVKAANSNGFWSPKVASIDLIIQPPWWATWWAYALYGLMAGGAIWGYIRFSTKRIRQRQELELNRRQAEQLKAVDELKTRFFSNITHEFRTPLSLIIAPVDKLLQEGRFDGPMLRLIRQNAEQLLRLINQLLDIAKLEGHYMTVSPMQGQMADFIRQIVAVFQRAAEQKSITLTGTMDHLPTQAHLFDADKWEKIFTNLLANALKFTGAGGSITLTAEPVWVEGKMTEVQFQLVDSGIGIAPQQLPYIFDRFYQADTSTTRPHEGTGLGLALVQELIQLLGGRISVESEVGTGTRFNWTLPVSPVAHTGDFPRISETRFHQPALDPRTPPESTPRTNPIGEEPFTSRILIVEDNEELRLFLLSELATTYHVLQAVDGHQGWEVTQAELPDIVLMDVMMPRMDGHELSRLIKGHPDTDHIAVVMLTAKTAQPSRLQGLQDGADDYLTKPFSMTELRLRLQNLVNRQQRLRERYEQQFLITPTLPTAATVVTHPFLERIYELMDERLDDPQLSVEWLADQLAMSRRTLHRKVISLTPWVPGELIRQYRIRKAAGLLRAGHTVAETADRVGFNTPSHFTTVFKEVYQQTPTEFTANLPNSR